MDIKLLLRELTDYLHHTRGEGNTHAMIYGSINAPCAIIVGNLSNKKYLNFLGDRFKVVATLEEVENGLLRGFRVPLVFDNSALSLIFQEVLRKIDSEDTNDQTLDPYSVMLKNIKDSGERIGVWFDPDMPEYPILYNKKTKEWEPYGPWTRAEKAKMKSDFLKNKNI